MNTVANILAGILLKRQLPSGGWSYFDSRQSSVEATSLAIMAVGLDAQDAQIPGTCTLACRAARGRQLGRRFWGFARGAGRQRSRYAH